MDRPPSVPAAAGWGSRSTAGVEGTVMWIERISFNGFGCFDTVEVRFERGLNVVVAPNEGGKSTLMRGIVASLYRGAVSQRRDTAALRRWGGGGAFRARVDFHLDGVRHSVVRDYGEGRQELVRGQ